MKENPTSDFQRCITLTSTSVPDVETTLEQRWYNFILTLFQRVLSISNNYIKTSRASDQYEFVNL